MSDTVKTGQEVELQVADKDFTFIVTRQAYNKFINSTTQVNKVAPMTNFLTTTVKPSQREELLALLQESAGADMQIGGALLEGYTPDLGVVVKKRSK